MSEINHIARLNREVEKLLAEAVAQRSVRLCQDGGRRIGQLVCRILSQHRMTADTLDGVSDTIELSKSFVEARCAAEQVPESLARDFADAPGSGFWRIVSPAIAASVPTGGTA